VRDGSAISHGRIGLEVSTYPLCVGAEVSHYELHRGSSISAGQQVMIASNEPGHLLNRYINATRRVNPGGLDTDGGQSLTWPRTSWIC